MVRNYELVDNWHGIGGEKTRLLDVATKLELRCMTYVQIAVSWPSPEHSGMGVHETATPRRVARGPEFGLCLERHRCTFADHHRER